MKIKIDEKSVENLILSDKSQFLGRSFKKKDNNVQINSLRKERQVFFKELSTHIIESRGFDGLDPSKMISLIEHKVELMAQNPMIEFYFDELSLHYSMILNRSISEVNVIKTLLGEYHQLFIPLEDINFCSFYSFYGHSELITTFKNIIFLLDKHKNKLSPLERPLSIAMLQKILIFSLFTQFSDKNRGETLELKEIYSVSFSKLSSIMTDFCQILDFFSSLKNKYYDLKKKITVEQFFVKYILPYKPKHKMRTKFVEIIEEIEAILCFDRETSEKQLDTIEAVSLFLGLNVHQLRKTKCFKELISKVSIERRGILKSILTPPFKADKSDLSLIAAFQSILHETDKDNETESHSIPIRQDLNSSPTQEFSKFKQHEDYLMNIDLEAVSLEELIQKSQELSVCTDFYEIRGPKGSIVDESHPKLLHSIFKILIQFLSSEITVIELRDQLDDLNVNKLEAVLNCLLDKLMYVTSLYLILQCSSNFITEKRKRPKHEIWLLKNRLPIIKAQQVS